MTHSAPAASDHARWVGTVALMFGAAVCLVGFHALSPSYADFLIPQEGVQTLPERELVFYAWYGLLGSLAALCLALAATRLGLGRPLTAAFERVRAEPARLALGIAAAAFSASWLFRWACLQWQPIADDEATYTFIARTLLAGKLVNPAPADPEFFRNQFVVLNEHGWYGKYPIGHPLWLAVGEALGVRGVMGPLAGGLCVWLTFRLGRRLVSERRALLGTLLLCASPHFVWTCATQLSQPTSCLALMLGAVCLVRSYERESVRAAAGAGVAFGFGILVRPLPGVLFASVALLSFLVRVVRSPGTQRRRRMLDWLVCAVLCMSGGIALLWVNHVQTGDWLRSGYHEVHPHMALLGTADKLANSVLGSLLRENFWLFGVPLSLLPVLWFRPRAHAVLWFGFIGAEVVYRVLAPKTVVGTTGPIYFTEVVPLLSLAAADGLVRAAGWLAKGTRAGSSLDPVAVLVAGAITAGSIFWPIELQTLRTGVQARSVLSQALAASHAERALVFADALVYPPTNVTWAYFPDNPSPRLDDAIVTVRIPKRDSLRTMQRFWEQHFSDRRAFVFTWGPNGEPLFRELSDYF